MRRFLCGRPEELVKSAMRMGRKVGEKPNIALEADSEFAALIDSVGRKTRFAVSG